MLRKLLSIYKNSTLFSGRPTHPSELVYTFYDEIANEWIGIPKAELGEKELTLLKTLYELVEIQPVSFSRIGKTWSEFLLSDGPPPIYKDDTPLRFIHFYITGDDHHQEEMESALKGFFSEEIIIIWESKNIGIVIEEKKQIFLSEEELLSMAETLESDFYVKISFFIGKLNPFSIQLRTKFKQEQEYFSFAIAYLGFSNILSFERVFPSYLVRHLPDELQQKINQEIFELFSNDTEMFSTIKFFLEQNLNASMTAKKLYIHRNTLQYRIDKFTEKTGIGLKDFYGAFTVFLACLLFEQQKK
ncbi:PucR family transcriptional regulator [Neobacillus bataviensis]|uniref:PucR family transcriptional regulator n=1 Tax=Neobacillus bataviensis TaxID=220685 RepID=UPI001CBF4AAD|nr:helix-turn-helix domain-containing protein [Neobacillus bataviensis]